MNFFGIEVHTVSWLVEKTLLLYQDDFWLADTPCNTPPLVHSNVPREHCIQFSLVQSQCFSVWFYSRLLSLVFFYSLVPFPYIVCALNSVCTQKYFSFVHYFIPCSQVFRTVFLSDKLDQGLIFLNRNFTSESNSSLAHSKFPLFVIFG